MHSVSAGTCRTDHFARSERINGHTIGPASTDPIAETLTQSASAHPYYPFQRIISESPPLGTIAAVVEQTVRSHADGPVWRSSRHGGIDGIVSCSVPVDHRLCVKLVQYERR